MLPDIPALLLPGMTIMEAEWTRISRTRYHRGEPLGRYPATVMRPGLRVGPWVNPATLEESRDRERRPYCSLAA